MGTMKETRCRLADGAGFSCRRSCAGMRGRVALVLSGKARIRGLV